MNLLEVPSSQDQKNEKGVNHYHEYERRAFRLAVFTRLHEQTRELGLPSDHRMSIRKAASVLAYEYYEGISTRQGDVRELVDRAINETPAPQHNLDQFERGGGI